jgi:dihydroneopterin triphosphate diphosphatase
MRRPSSVLVYPVALINSEWMYLLFHRVPRPDLELPSFWQGITGGLKEEESPEDAAKREFMEETGISPLKIEQVGFTCTIPVEEKWRYLYLQGVQEITEHVFVAYLQGHQEPVLSFEHDISRWCTKTEALQLLLHDGNIEALRRSDNYLRTHNDKQAGT